MQQDHISVYTIASALRDELSGVTDRKIYDKYDINPEVLNVWKNNFSHLLELSESQLAKVHKQHERLQLALEIDGTDEEKKLNYRIALKHAFNSLLYISRVGAPPNYIRPSLWTEKMQWRKHFDRNPLLAIYCNKLFAREYVKSKAPDLDLPKIFWMGEKVDSLTLSAVTTPCVMKSSNGCGDVFIVKDPGQISMDELGEINNRWKSKPAHGIRFGEWGYSQTKRVIFAEEFIGDVSDSLPIANIKFFIFSGITRYIQVESYSDKGYHLTFFNRDGSRMPVRKWIGYKKIEDMPEPDFTYSLPSNFEKMRSIAESLGDNIDHVRVDLYSHQNRVVFSELTPYDGTGFSYLYNENENFNIRPSYDVNKEVGSWWNLPNEK